MPTWSAVQYLKFGDERTQPSRDLAGRIEVAQPLRVLDLGCGPGNSTAILGERWPEAEITGLDNSSKMIEAARAAYPQYYWLLSDIGSVGLEAWQQDFDVIFSNAALQWVPDHASLLPRLMQSLIPRGALAFQMPAYDSPAHRILRDLAAARSLTVSTWHSHEPTFYYDVLSPCAARVDIWSTEYLHVLDNQESIVDWYRGTGMRPYLDALPAESDRERFTTEFLERLRPVYPPRSDGRILFPFRRIFAIAYRQ